MSKGKHTWSETEKLGALVIAVREGVPEASRRLKVPQSTVYTWLQAAGGIAEVRTLANMRAEEALSKAEMAVYELMSRRMKADNAPDAELHTTFRALVRSRLGDGATPSDGKAGAAANAQVAVHNWTINTGEDLIP